MKFAVRVFPDRESATCDVHAPPESKRDHRKLWNTGGEADLW